MTYRIVYRWQRFKVLDDVRKKRDKVVMYDKYAEAPPAVQSLAPIGDVVKQPRLLPII